MTTLTSQTNLYSQVAELLNLARTQVARTINSTMTQTYFEIGRLIVEDEQGGEARAEYGKYILEDLSKRLTPEFGKGFSKRNLEQMRKFYLTYSISKTASWKLQSPDNNGEISTLPIAQTVSAQLQSSDNNEQTALSVKSEKLSSIFNLSWSHYLFLMRIDNENERKFYEIESAENNWSLKELKRQFNTSLYERLALSRDKEGVMKLAQEGQVITRFEDTIKEPYTLEFLGLPEDKRYSESELEQSIIDKLEHFLLELGKGFLFVGRQVRFTFSEKHFKVDLVFYNRILKCFVLVDLKIGEVTHQDLGQMQMYVNYYDREMRMEDENKTIGIVLCKDKNEAVVRYTLPEENNQIFATKYQTVLPSKEEFKRVLGE
ncbi:MAG: YhcG family protein [Mangrovibacterium sp.]